MAQPQSQPPPRAFSPPQPSPSPVNSQTGYGLPPNKRARTDGPSSQPNSPYPGSPYMASPVAGNTPPNLAGSPSYPQPAMPPATPLTNGHAPTGLTLPDARANMPSPSPVSTPQPMQPPTPQYTSATLAPLAHNAAPTPPPAGTMGPPQRPADRPTKDYEYDVTDSLAGTGIDLRAEEQFMSDLYSNAFDANADARAGFGRLPPGAKSTMYGAGPANQPAQASDPDQQKAMADAAQQAWTDSSMRLGVQRTQEMNDPFLSVALMHRFAEKAAKEHHLELNLDLKSNPPTIGKMRLPDHFPTTQVTVSAKTGPESTMITTTGSFIPQDAFLVDQLALLSIATKQRLRDLMQDADLVATTRQKTSHGDVPEDWKDAAAPMNAEPLGEPQKDESGMELDDAVTNGNAPLKRSAQEAGLEGAAQPMKLAKISSYMAVTMRDLARQEREWEEARLRRRQKRKDGTAEGTSTPSRANSVALGTPGSIAPDSEKSMTKKELKKNQALKNAEVHSHANQNMTSSMFAGLGGKSGLFGKKKVGKSYDWMNVGRGGSGTSTPTKAGPGGGRPSVGAPGAGPPTNLALTSEGRNRLGTWREDREKGKAVQLRDWITALERDGRHAKALQYAYARLDESGPR